MKCFETIKVLNGKIFNLEYHNIRFNKTRKKLFGGESELNLKEFISPPKKGLYRCKVVYSKEIESIEFFPYQEKQFSNFQIVNINFNYSHKFLDRSAIDEIKANYDEIIMLKDGFLTDTSIANIAIYNESWLTPKEPLLYGTTRDKLIEKGFLKEKNLTIDDLLNAKKFAIMNAMIGFKEIVLWKVSL